MARIEDRPIGQWRSWAGLILALAMCAAGIAGQERPRAGISITQGWVGQTPVRIYLPPADPGPIVVIAHGFAGSRQMMEGYALTLADAGYRVHSFDFEGHGRNPVPMSGDVTSVDGTTARLVAQTRKVMAAARDAAPGQPLAVLGHSMASDVIVRAALADGDVAAVVGISMFSRAVTATRPARLLMISGAGEPHLRRAAVAALQLVDPSAQEGSTATAGAVTRRAVVAPGVEHVGVLYSPSALREALAFLDRTFGRDTPGGPVINPGPWLVLVLTGIVLLTRWGAGRLPVTAGPRPRAIGWRGAVLACVIPAVATPLGLAVLPDLPPVLPMLVADDLALHLGVYGILQLVVLRWLGRRPDVGLASWPVALGLAGWGILGFGTVLDMYGGSFSAAGGRWPVIAALCLGAMPFMLADAVLTARGDMPLLGRSAARLAMLGSLGLAVALDPEGLFFLVIVMPVIVLFLIVFGLMGRWVRQRAGSGAAGLGLGVILAYSLGVTFPMFVP